MAYQHLLCCGGDQKEETLDRLAFLKNVSVYVRVVALLQLMDLVVNALAYQYLLCCSCAESSAACE